jgi:hypothetical protein
MRILRHPLFLLCALLFCLNRALELGQVYIWPLYAYLDDLLCLPLTLSVILAAQRAYFKDDEMTVPLAHIAFAVTAFSLFFEVLLPLYKKLYTADVLDIGAYALGAVFFQVYMNRPLAASAVME